ncbi:MAG: pirin-like C-terminal cupin domain-containing protein, partial [Myxococcota bacterium]
VGLPQAEEDTDPVFEHTPAEAIPEIRRPGVTLRVLAGEAFGARSPVTVRSRLGYVEARLDAGGTLTVPGDLWAERAVYVVEGEVLTDGEPHPPFQLAVLCPGRDVAIAARSSARMVIIGGDPLDGPRFLFWNFVSSDREAIERAKADWRHRRFPEIPGDAQEFVPLPGE